MNEVEVRSLFALARLEILRMWRLENRYWPNLPAYDEIRRDHPWWLVSTEHGLIEIGWRKRVISIDWSETPLRAATTDITSDDVTKTNALVHAWSIEKALEYLTALRKAFESRKARIAECTE